MYRGGTPELRYELPMAYEGYVEKCRLTFKQNERTVLEKRESDFTVNGNMISVKLTQEETLKFSKGDYTMQLKIKTLDGNILYSEKISEFVKGTLNEEVL